jgi:threonylcarbamoyladenosine tRNA methylthiotransferase MtaB
VPYLRGSEVSYSPESIIENINKFVDGDYFEVVLTGIHIGKYKYEKYNLTRLLKKVCDETSIKRIRLSSIEPIEFTDELLEFVASEDRIADYYHIPLQSGSDTVLERMKRPYHSDAFVDVIKKINKLMPQAGIGTDIIAGFPGESDREFEETMTLIRDLPLSNMHVFPYSIRPGTVAANMPNQISNAQKKERIKELRAIRLLKKHEFYSAYIGKEQKYLIEQFNSERCIFRGTSSNYVQCKTVNNSLVIGNEFTLIGERIEGEYLICK